MVTDVKQIGNLVQQKSEFVRALFNEMDKVIIGQRYMLERMLVGLLANGHILLEGVPGLAKILAVTILSRTIDAGFHRIQFTPDLLPADLIGTQIYRQSDGQFYTRKGPIFANIILADEINRGPCKSPKRSAGGNAGAAGLVRQAGIYFLWTYLVERNTSVLWSGPRAKSSMSLLYPNKTSLPIRRFGTFVDPV